MVCLMAFINGLLKAFVNGFYQMVCREGVLLKAFIKWFC
jgi:hypothetical protein